MKKWCGFDIYSQKFLLSKGICWILGVQCLKRIYKSLKIICRIGQATSNQVKCSPFQTWFINMSFFIVKKDKTLDTYKRTSFFIKDFHIFIKFLITYFNKLDKAIWGAFYISYSSISSSNFITFFTVFIPLKIWFSLQCKIIMSSWWCSYSSI